MLDAIGSGEIDAGFGYTLLALSIWALIWKGLALWKTANEKRKPWFIAILILNTLGILEIIYLALFQKKPWIKVKNFKLFKK